MTTAIGTAPPSLNRPTVASPNWIVPGNAEADPARLGNGPRATATAFGETIPRLATYQNNAMNTNGEPAM